MPDSVKSESVSQLLVQQLDQTTFAESAVRQWEDDLHRFAAYLTPLEPPIAILDSWDTLNDFLEANQALLSSLQNVPLLTQETQEVKTTSQLFVYPAEPSSKSFRPTLAKATQLIWPVWQMLILKVSLKLRRITVLHLLQRLIPSLDFRLSILYA